MIDLQKIKKLISNNNLENNFIKKISDFTRSVVIIAKIMASVNFNIKGAEYVK